jgi:hypothetical protein
MSATDPPYLSWKIHDDPHGCGGRVFRQSKGPGNARSKVGHRGIHDKKNGGFSTIGSTPEIFYSSRSDAAPEQFFRFQKNFPELRSGNFGEEQ